MADVLDRSRPASLRQVENRVAALGTSSAIMSPVARRKGSPLVTSTSRKTARRERRDGVRPAAAVEVRGPRGPLRENVGGAPPNATRCTEQPPPASAGRGSSSSVPSPSAGVAPPPTPPTPPPAPPPAPPGDDEEVDVLAGPRWSPPHRARTGSAFAGSGDADSQRPRGALSLTGLVAPTSDVEGIGGEAWGAREEEWGAREEEWGARGALSVDPGRLFHSAPLQRIVGGWDRAAVSSTAFEAAPDPGLSLSTIESQGTSEASLRAPAGAPSRRPRVPRDDEKLRRLREVVSRQRAERGGTGTGEPRHGEERAALPVFSEPPRLLAAKVRKVASAPPAPVYRGEWRCVHVRAGAPPGGVQCACAGRERLPGARVPGAGAGPRTAPPLLAAAPLRERGEGSGQEPGACRDCGGPSPRTAEAGEEGAGGTGRIRHGRSRRRSSAHGSRVAHHHHVVVARRSEAGAGPAGPRDPRPQPRGEGAPHGRASRPDVPATRGAALAAAGSRRGPEIGQSRRGAGTRRRGGGRRRRGAAHSQRPASRRGSRRVPVLPPGAPSIGARGQGSGASRRRRGGGRSAARDLPKEEGRGRRGPRGRGQRRASSARQEGPSQRLGVIALQEQRRPRAGTGGTGTRSDADVTATDVTAAAAAAAAERGAGAAGEAASL
ncbi:uncharacterized protein LOC144951215 [Lampetra fluviatilis]